MGHEPFKLIYEDCVSTIASKATQGAWYKDWLLVSFDGSSLDVADTPDNDREFGRHVSDRGVSAFPKSRLVTLIENGTRVLFGAAAGAYAGVNATSEMDLMRGSGVVLRSKTPELVKQEFYAFLLSYFAVRGLMHEAALKADLDPDRLSFRHAIKVIRRRIPAFGIFPPAAMV